MKQNHELERDDQDFTPAEVLEQDVPVGGVVNGARATAAVSVLPQGIQTFREVPSLKAATGSALLTAAGSPWRIGKEPRRRTLIIGCGDSVTVGAYLCIATSQLEATQGYGLRIYATDDPITLHTVNELWIQPFAADLVLSWLAEIDQG